MTNAFQTLRPKATPGPTKAPREHRQDKSPFNQQPLHIDTDKEREAKRLAAIEREALAILQANHRQRTRVRTNDRGEK